MRNGVSSRPYCYGHFNVPNASDTDALLIQPECPLYRVSEFWRNRVDALKSAKSFLFWMWERKFKRKTVNTIPNLNIQEKYSVFSIQG